VNAQVGVFQHVGGGDFQLLGPLLPCGTILSGVPIKRPLLGFFVEDTVNFKRGRKINRDSWNACLFWGDETLIAHLQEFPPEGGRFVYMLSLFTAKGDHRPDRRVA
jgi:hypothetical protein